MRSSSRIYEGARQPPSECGPVNGSDEIQYSSFLKMHTAPKSFIWRECLCQRARPLAERVNADEDEATA